MSTTIPSTRNAGETRRLLMEAGRDLFAERGFDGAGVEEIARRAGVNKALINYHFKGKAGLYGAILDSVFDPILENLREIVHRDVPADEKLHLYFGMMLRLHDEQSRFPQMVVREVVSGGRHIDARLLPKMAGVFEGVRGIIQQGIDEGRFRPVDPFLTYLSLTGGLVFFFATESFRRRILEEQKVFGMTPPSGDAFVRQVEDLYLTALRRPAEEVADPEVRS